MKKNIGSQLALYPTPVTVIGAMNKDKPTWTLVEISPCTGGVSCGYNGPCVQKDYLFSDSPLVAAFTSKLAQSAYHFIMLSENCHRNVSKL